MAEARVFADLRGQGGTTGAGHVQVHQYQVGREQFQRRHHACGFGHHFGHHPGPAQDRLGEDRLAAIVLDDQNPIGVLCSACAAGVLRAHATPRWRLGNRIWPVTWNVPNIFSV